MVSGVGNTRFGEWRDFVMKKKKKEETERKEEKKQQENINGVENN